jgi:hypothetical protein
MTLSQTLYKQASDLAATSPEFVAVGLLKQAGLSETDARMQIAQSLMEKEAVDQMISRGITEAQAQEMVKLANVQVTDLASFELDRSVEERCAEILEKAAGLVKELEDQVATLQKQAQESGAVKPDYIQKLASSGNFTNEDLDALMRLPSETLTKVASASDEPWSMGKGAGQSVAGMDPLAAFLLS